MKHDKANKLLTWLAACLLPLQLQAQSGATLIADFDPTAGILPNPINLLFTGSQDGTVNIPVDPSDPSAGTINALNALDGFSTVAPITAPFSNGVLPIPGNPVPIVSAIKADTVIAGQTVRLFEVDLVNPFTGQAGTPFTVNGVRRELSATEFAASVSPLDATGKTVVIVPLVPLKAKTGYMVVLTNGIRAELDGSPAVADQTYTFARYRGDHHRPLVGPGGSSNFPRLSDAQARALEQLQPLILSQEEAAFGAGVVPGSIAVSWTFLTQSTEDALAAVRSLAAPQAATLIPTGTATPLGAGDVLVGTLQVPYFLEAPTIDPTVILRTRWLGINSSEVTRYNPLPVVTQNITIPMLASIPSGVGKPTDGWPTVIFQHGITTNRKVMLGVADALAGAGFAVIAIDLPLHGITDTDDPLYNAPMERHFNTDLINNETLAPGPDGIIDPSGIHTINLASLLTSRDNGRQAVTDLFHLTATVPTIDIDGDGAADFDGNRLYFVGHSLGGILGTPYLALEPAIRASTLANPGGGVAKLLDGSASFGPIIQAGLASVGLIKGTAEYEAFLGAFQTAVDSFDPINFGAVAADLHPIHMIEVVGSADSPPDQTVPNSVPGAPLAGTEPLARIMALATIGTTTSDAGGVRGIVRFTAGNHASILSPAAPPTETASPATTVEMQTQTAGFAASDGMTVLISDPTVVQPAP